MKEWFKRYFGIRMPSAVMADAVQDFELDLDRLCKMKLTPLPVDLMDTLASDAAQPPQPRKAFTCSQCGAPIHGDRCEYCGAWYTTKDCATMHSHDEVFLIKHVNGARCFSDDGVKWFKCYSD